MKDIYIHIMEEKNSLSALQLTLVRSTHINKLHHFSCDLKELVLSYDLQTGQETDFVLVSCTGLGIEPSRREQVLKAKRVCPFPEFNFFCKDSLSAALFTHFRPFSNLIILV